MPTIVDQFGKPAILDEGVRQRGDIQEWICLACAHYVRYLEPNGTCPNCKMGTPQPIYSRDAEKARTRALKETQAVKPFSPGFDPTKAESQVGRPLTLTQLLSLINKFVPGVVMKLQFNVHLGRTLAALYVPFRGTAIERTYLSQPEQTDNIQFLCAAEPNVMPEWDVVLKDANNAPTGIIRGWRSVLGIFYRAGLMPFTQDDGQRLSNWQIQNSPAKGRQ